jgi:hypothetical protein
MNLRDWIFDELTEARRRLSDQVLARVPVERRLEQPGGGNSIAYATWHVAVHADIAINGVLRGKEPRLASLPAAAALPAGFGLEEAEHPDIRTLPDDLITGYGDDVFADVGTWLPAVDDTELERPVDGAATLQAVGVSEDAYGWLYRMWQDKPAAYFLRWEAVGHLTNHVGEMIATRNRMGLSPF